MKPLSLIRHALSRPKRYFVLLMLLSAFCIAFIGFVDTFYQVTYSLNYSDQVYGSYTGRLEQLKQPCDVLTNRLNACSEIDYVIPYYAECTEQGFEADLYGVDDDFWDNTEYELMEGAFPANNRELLCDATYLFRYEISYEDMIGSEISFHGRNYRVCGLFRANRLYTDGTENYRRSCFTRLDGQPNAVLYRINERSDTRIRELLSRCNLSASIIQNFNDVVKKRAKSQFSTITEIIFLLLITASAFMVIHILTLILAKHKKHLEILNLLGISNRSVFAALFLKTVSALFLGVLIGVLLYGVSLAAISAMYRYIGNLHIKQILDMLPVIKLVSTAFLFFLALSVFSVIFVWIAVRKAGKQSGATEHTIRIQQMKGKLPDHISPSRVAVRHIRTALVTTVGTAMILAVTVAAFHCVRLFFQASAQNALQYEGWNYRLSTAIDSTLYSPSVSLKTDTIQSEIDLQEAIDSYAKRLANQKFDLQEKQLCDIDILRQAKSKTVHIAEIYSCCLRSEIGRSSLSDALLAHLMRQESYHNRVMSASSTIEIPVTLIGLPNEEIQRIFGESGQDGQAWSLRRFTDEITEGNQFLFSEGERIRLGESDIVLTGTLAEYENDLIPFRNTLTVFVNLNTYRQITKCAVPSEVFVRASENDREHLNNLFKKLHYLDIFDLSVSEQVRRQQLCQKWVLASAMALLIVFASFCAILTIYMRSILFMREYGIFFLLGLSKQFTNSVIRKEVHAVLMPAFAASAVILLLFIKSYNASAAQVNLCAIRFPILIWALTCMILEIVGLLFATVMERQFRDMSAV